MGSRIKETLLIVLDLFRLNTKKLAFPKLQKSLFQKIALCVFFLTFPLCLVNMFFYKKLISIIAEFQFNDADYHAIELLLKNFLVLNLISFGFVLLCIFAFSTIGVVYSQSLFQSIRRVIDKIEFGNKSQEYTEVSTPSDGYFHELAEGYNKLIYQCDKAKK